MEDALRKSQRDESGGANISLWELVAGQLFLVLDLASASWHQEFLYNICIVSHFIALNTQGIIICSFSIGPFKKFKASPFFKLLNYQG